MGHVYEVRHVALDRRFAMKVLRRDLARDEELAGRFIQEAKATASVRHPNVVEITDFGKLPDGVPYFVMELLVGQTLGRRHQARRPDPRAARGAHHPAGGERARGGARGGHRPSRPQAGQRVPRRRRRRRRGERRRARRGLRRGEDRRLEPRDAPGHRLRHAALHVARAGERAAGRPPRGRLRARHHHVRDVHGQGALRGRHVHGRAHAAHVRAAAAARARSTRRRASSARSRRSRWSCLAKKPEERYGSMVELVGGARRGRAAGQRRARRDRRPPEHAARASRRRACATAWPTSSSRRRSRRCASPSTACCRSSARCPGAWIVGGGRADRPRRSRPGLIVQRRAATTRVAPPRLRRSHASGSAPRARRPRTPARHARAARRTRRARTPQRPRRRPPPAQQPASPPRTPVPEHRPPGPIDDVGDPARGRALSARGATARTPGIVGAPPCPADASPSRRGGAGGCARLDTYVTPLPC